ncbi:MAG: hypothetical protein ABIK28_15340, partial [Planctomycetota bacterium]
MVPVPGRVPVARGKAQVLGRIPIAPAPQGPISQSNSGVVRARIYTTWQFEKQLFVLLNKERIQER